VTPDSEDHLFRDIVAREFLMSGTDYDDDDDDDYDGNRICIRTILQGVCLAF